jgi:hypothetical protein
VGTHRSTERRAVPRTAVTGIVLCLVFAAGVGILQYLNTELALRSLELAGTVAFAVVLSAPALLALAGLRERPSLLVAAGVLGLVLAFLSSFALVGLVFVAPAVLFLVAAGQLRSEEVRPRGAIAAVLVPVVLGLVAFFALLVHDDPACWATDAVTGETSRLEVGVSVEGGSISVTTPPGTSESGCSSDVITPVEGLVAIGIVGLMLGVGWSLARPTSSRAAPVVPTG